MNRASLIALIHTGARALGWDEDTRRAWMEKTVGKRSAKECSEAELARLAEALRAAGFQPAPPARRLGGRGPDRPTDAQLGRIIKLARQRGFTGLDDPGLATFARRVCKLDGLRFLTLRGAQSLIIGLGKWAAYDKTHPAKPVKRPA